MALISVLWLIALLTLLATAATTLTVTQRRAAARALESAELDALADSAIRVVLLRSIAPLPRAAEWPVGVATSLQLPGGTVAVTLDLEAARVDVNTADEKYLLGALTAHGWALAAAQSFVARVADWKDADDAPHAGGAELHEYRAQGRPYGPRNAPFESVNELRQVLGGEALDDAVLGEFTVYSHRELPDVRTRTASTEAQTLSGEVVRIRACAHGAAGERCRLLIARVTGNVRNPAQVFVWETRG